ncbi:MAG TPA: phosphate propanoyltransferase [Symbiobacteriaceae bacterium]|jgi:putative phosphotransacetylase
MTEEEVVQLIAREVVARIREARVPEGRAPDPRDPDPRKMVPVNISARHLHLSPAHVEALFGPAGLTVLRPLMQPGQFAANETAAVIGPKGAFPKVRVLGPARGDTQLELSLTDARTLGLDVPVRLSGNVAGTPGITLETARGRVTVPQGVIVAARHIHLDPATAARFGMQQGQQVQVRTTGVRPLIFDGVVVRVSERFVPEFHVDTDEGNAAAVRDGDLMEILA